MRSPISSFWLLRHHRVALLFTLGTLTNALNANVLMSIGTATGANTKIDTANAYTYNFGITSSASGLNLSQISMQVGKAPNQSNPIIVQIYSGFGGNVGGNQLIHTTELAASSFSGTSTSAYTLNLSSALSLAPGAYSVRLTSAASTTTSYLFRDGLLALGGGVVTQNQWIQDSNTSGSAGSTITPAAGYILADHKTSTESIDLGRYHASAAPRPRRLLSPTPRLQQPATLPSRSRWHKAPSPARHKFPGFREATWCKDPATA